jgi:HAD superfamily hydrolase (TIGR01662 family)
MGRFSNYIDSITEYRQSRKSIGMSIFGVLLDDSTIFTPGDMLNVYEHVPEALSVLNQKGYDFVLITGQPNRRSKNIDQKDFENIIAAMQEMFTDLGCTIRGSYYTNLTEKSDPYVKPNTGMFKKAESDKKITWNESFYIGVDTNDIKAANAVNATPILLGTLSDIDSVSLNKINLQTFKNLLEFAKAI